MSDFTKEDYDLMAATMILGLKDLEPAKRAKAGILVNNLFRMSKGLDAISHEEYNEQMKERSAELDRVSPLGSFDDVLEEIKSYVRKTGCKVALVPADDPALLRLGWCDVYSNRCWTIRLCDMRSWINKLNDFQREIAVKSMATPQGKVSFATSLTEQVNVVLDK